MERPRLANLPFLLVLVAGCALRFYHLGTFSLWWDEIVHVWTSQSGSLLDVLAEVKRGIPPGAGNAGAVPLDYLLLHLYLSVTPAPSPEMMEVYYRFPSFLYSCLSLPLMYAFGRRFLDHGVALLSTLLLALSLPHVLYAAEARFYSLFVLTTIANLYVFAHLLSRRDSPAAWIGYGAMAIVYFFSGLFSLFVLFVQYSILGLLLAGAALGLDSSSAERSRASLLREASSLFASALVLFGCVASYFADTSLTVKYNRDPSRVLEPMRLAWETYLAFSSGSYLLFACLLLLPLPLLYGHRRGSTVLAFVVYLELSLLGVPLIVELARWKHYYFHQRHALFLLPAVEILIAISLLSLLRGLELFRFVAASGERRNAANLITACALVLAVQLPTVRAYLSAPGRFFAQSKKTYDLKQIAQELSREVANYGPREKYLLIAPRNSVANTGLAQYLRWYGLGDRVVFRATLDAPKTLVQMREICAAGCLGKRGPFLDRQLQLVGAMGLTPEFRRLLGLLEPVGYWPGTVRRLGLLSYGPPTRDPPRTGFSVHTYRGVQLFEPVDGAAPTGSESGTTPST